MKLKINKTFTKEPKTKIRNQKNNKWIWNINNKENRVIILEGGERKEEEKRGLLATNWPSNTDTGCPKRKRMQQCLQRYSERVFLDDKKRHAYRLPHVICAPPTFYLFYSFLFIYENIQLP
jgi:hypothetical protein